MSPSGSLKETETDCLDVQGDDCRELKSNLKASSVLKGYMQMLICMQTSQVVKRSSDSVHGKGLFAFFSHPQ